MHRIDYRSTETSASIIEPISSNPEVPVAFFSIVSRFLSLIPSIADIRLVAVFLMLITASLHAQDRALLRSQIVDEFSNSTADPVELQGWIDSQNNDGSWPDVNYADTKRTNWQPYVKHIQRLSTMASAYRTASHSMHNDIDLVNAVSRGIDYWLVVRPVSTNWWPNDIGVPRHIGRVGALLYDHLTADQKSGIISLIKGGPSMTGQNRVWISQTVILRGLLEESNSRIESGFNGISDAIFLTTGEGIQHDGSFHQHDNQLQSGAYGKSFLGDIALFAVVSRNTGFGIDSSKLSLISEMALNGSAWMVRGDTFDYSASGRELARPDRTANASSLATTFERLAQVDTVNAIDYQSASDQISGSLSEGPMGNRYFWRSDYLTQRSPEALVSIRMASERVQVPEEVNSENKHARYLGFGCQMIYQDGDDYDDIFPVWDWRKIPGTTVLQDGTDPAVYGYPDGPDTFVGGVSDGKYGLACMDHAYESIKAKKSWFFFDGGFVALGVGVKSTKTASETWTTINQTLLDGDVAIDGITQLPGERLITNPGWIHHDSIGYVLLDDAEVFARNDEQSGAWSDINSSYSSATINKNVFLMAINHGYGPTDASYAYTVLLGVTASETETFFDAPFVEILSNTASVQAVKITSQNRAYIVFYEAGSQDTGLGMKITVDVPCAVMVHLDDDDLAISASNPNASATKLNMFVSGEMIGNDAIFNSNFRRSEIEFQFTAGAYGGQPKTKLYQWKEVITDGSPIPQISVGSTPVLINELTTFDASESLPDASPITSYEWNFNDGEIANGVTVQHSFSQPGEYHVRLKVTDEGGRVAFATVTVIVLGVVRIPESDAFVRGGDSATSNFGNATTISVKGTNSLSFAREGFLKFDISDLDFPVNEAYLLLTVNSTEDASTRSIELYKVNDDSWEELELNWNNKPAIGDLIEQFDVSFADVGKQISINITEYLNESITQNYISFALTQPNNQNHIIKFYSSESTIGPPEISVPFGYGHWEKRWLPVGSLEPNDDYDGDGRSNIVEYVMGSNPTSGKDSVWGMDEPIIFNTLKNSDGSRNFQYLVEWMASDITPEFEYSTNLVQWNPVPQEDIIISGSSYFISTDLDSSSMLFYRFKAEAP